MKNKAHVGIVGGAGYTGGETLRLLLHHPHVNVTSVQSRSQAGKPVVSIHKDLIGETDLHFSPSSDEDLDVVFLCLGHGESKEYLQANPVDEKTKVIDLSQDFRLQPSEFVYGLPEASRNEIRVARCIANPGCFATAIQLALLPLAKHKLLTSVCVTGITGSTGAGQKLQDSSHFSWRQNNISPYKTLTHQHVPEVLQTLKKYQPEFQDPLNFIPWRGDFTRGILVSACMPADVSKEEARDIYTSYYSESPFVFVVESVDIKQCVNTNKGLISIEHENGYLVVHTVIDNLLKGASGQAVQNMNLMFGWEEHAGLQLKAAVF